MTEKNEDIKTKQKKSLFIFNINTILALVAILISILSYSEAIKNNSLTEESIRPQVKLNNFKAYYDDKNVEFKFTLINTGKSTAVIDDFIFTTLNLDGTNIQTYHNLKSKIIEPNKKIEGITNDKRFLKLNNSNFELDQIAVKPKDFNFTYKYYIHGKSNIKFEESSTSISTEWIRKSNKTQ